MLERRQQLVLSPLLGWALLQQVVREYLEIYEDEKLFGQMQSEARRSGYREADAVHLVRQARREMKKQNGAS